MMRAYLVALDTGPRNPLRWMRGPRLRYSQPRTIQACRLPTEKMNAIWKATDLWAKHEPDTGTRNGLLGTILGTSDQTADRAHEKRA
jgi:hypothetical protein